MPLTGRCGVIMQLLECWALLRGYAGHHAEFLGVHGGVLSRDEKMGKKR